MLLHRPAVRLELFHRLHHQFPTSKSQFWRLHEVEPMNGSPVAGDLACPCRVSECLGPRALLAIDAGSRVSDPTMRVGKCPPIVHYVYSFECQHAVHRQHILSDTPSWGQTKSLCMSSASSLGSRRNLRPEPSSFHRMSS
jgi:hypothetical protein